MVGVVPETVGTQLVVEWVNNPVDWKRIRDLRLEALANDRESFYPGSADFEAAAPDEFWSNSFQTGLWCVARIGHEDVGVACLRRDEHGSEDRYVEKVWVREDRRRAGVATAMVQQLILWAQPYGKVFLWVMTHNDVARNLYVERFGFIPSGEPQRTPGDRAEERLFLNLT